MAHVTHARKSFVTDYTFRFAPRVAITHRRVTHAVADYSILMRSGCASTCSYHSSACYTRRSEDQNHKFLSVFSVLSVPSVLLFKETRQIKKQIVLNIPNQTFLNPRAPRNPCNPREVQARPFSFMILKASLKPFYRSVLSVKSVVKPFFAPTVLSAGKDACAPGNAPPSSLLTINY